MAAPAPGAHVTETFSGTTTHTSAALSTSTGNMVVVCIHMENLSAPFTVTSVTDTIGNTYHKRSSQQWVDTGTVIYNDQEIWYTVSTGTNASNAITVTASATVDDAGFIGFIVTGQNSTPWDSNAALPAKAQDTSGTSSAPTVNGASNSNADSLIIGFASAGWNKGMSVGTIAGSTATLISNWTNSGGTKWSYGYVEYAQFTSVQTGYSGNFSSAAAGSWGMIVDTITADGAPPPPPPPPITTAYMFT